MTNEKTKSINKALDILEVFLRVNKAEIGLMEISNITGYNRSTTRRIMSTLVDRDYLRQDIDKGKYALGGIYANYSKLISKDSSLKSIAEPFLMELSRAVNESVVFAILEGDSTISTNELFDNTLSPNSILTIAQSDNSPLPLYCTSIGKIILANLTDEKIRRYFKKNKLIGFTANTITSVEAFLKCVRTVRRRHIATDNEEYNIGVRSVAMGLRDKEGKLIAVIAIIAPSVRLSMSKIKEIAPKLQKCITNISRKISVLKRNHRVIESHAD